jgi:hypothetical protein
MKFWLKIFLFIITICFLTYLVQDDIRSHLFIRFQKTEYEKKNQKTIDYTNSKISQIKDSLEKEIRKLKEKISFSGQGYSKEVDNKNITSHTANFITVQLISLENSFVQSDSFAAEIRFVNHGKETCYIQNNVSHHIFFDTKVIPPIPAFAIRTNDQLDISPLKENDEINMTCFFNLQPLINHRKNDHLDYQVSDTCEIGIWAHFLGDASDAGNIIKGIVVSIYNDKIKNINISDAKQPVTITGK